MNAPTIIHQAAGAPRMTGDQRGVCRTCDQIGIGMEFAEWVADTFMDWDKLYPGSIICHACQFAFDESSAALAARLGKPLQRIMRMRNYSHFVVNGEWSPISKGAKRRMAELLLSDPDLACIAFSGQKHILFRARPGWWQIEEQTVRPFLAELRRLLAVVEELYEGGISKSEIETGRYSDRRILEFGFARWRAIEAEIKPQRGTVRLALAVFLAQKEGAEDGSIRDGECAADPDLAGYPGELQEPVSDQNLAAVRGQYPQRSLHRDPQPLLQQSLFALGGQDRD